MDLSKRTSAPDAVGRGPANFSSATEGDLVATSPDSIGKRALSATAFGRLSGRTLYSTNPNPVANSSIAATDMNCE